MPEWDPASDAQRVSSKPSAFPARARAASPDHDAAPRDPHAAARAIVLRQLDNSPKTRAQLESKLADRECDPAVAKAVLDRFEEVGLVNDAAYAEVYGRSSQLTRGLSRTALTRELPPKGIVDDVAAEVLDRVSDAEELERARTLVAARLPRLHGLDRTVQVRRLAGLLSRKGYPSGMVAKVVFEAVDASDQHQRE